MKRIVMLLFACTLVGCWFPKDYQMSICENKCEEVGGEYNNTFDTDTGLECYCVFEVSAGDIKEK